jgi:UPF0716 protein FxsA
MRAGGWLLLILLGLPILEIALFIEVGGLIGLWPTLGLVVLGALAGVTLIRRQGLNALERLRRSVAEGGNPVGPIAHGALILVAGMLLLIPGFFTDTIGLLLLIPAVRARVIGWGAARLTVRATTFVYARGPRRQGPGDAIEADYEVIDEEEAPRRPGNSGWTRP